MITKPLALVVARSSNGVIGKAGVLPWNIPEDLAHFRRVTLDHSVIMGRATYDSIGKPLRHRRNIVVSRRALFIPGCEVAANLDQALRLAYETDREPRIIGGASIYTEALPLVTRLFLTEIHEEFEGDTFFQFDLSCFKEILRFSGERLTFIELERF